MYRFKKRRPGYRKISYKPEPRKQTGIDPAIFVKKADPSAVPLDEPVTISFSELELLPEIKNTLEKRGFSTPTPIQAKAIPPILEGRDVIGLANTGTGKTGAFVLPLIQKVLQNPSERILILVPTRELGLQIKEELVAFSQGMRIYSTLIIGGANMKAQIFNLRRNPHFVIGTPGRVKDLIDRGEIHANRIGNVVLDEADRMVDMGFIKDITYILAKLPQERHSLFFSATLPQDVAPVIRKHMKDPVRISVIKGETAANVEQDVIYVSPEQNKIEVLAEMLAKDEYQKVIIFGRTKRGVDRLTQSLSRKGISAVSIHGDKPQRKREQTIRAFKSHRAKVLVATDVAARGIDIPNVSHVINYDWPATHEDYIHRIGRTGRGDKKGIALTFI